MKKLLLLLTSITLLFSCKEDDSNIDEPTIEANAVRLLTNSTHGNILTDADGISLYFFSKDTKEISECNDGCKVAWPIFYSENLTLDEGLDASDFGEITRADGDKQNTYKGWPLYYYASDSATGDVNGDGAGDNWYVAKPDYTLMYAQTDDLGFYMTNASGRTIYLFGNDTANTNNFTNEDFSNDGAWPIVTLDLDKIPSIFDENDFGTTDVYGSTQLTYKGWPLYYFGSDTERGDANGVSGIWPTVNVDTEAAITAEVTNTVQLIDDSTYGNILTDADGISLYFFSKDTKEISECTDGCKAAWPVFYSEELVLSEGLDASDFGEITRADGDKQTTYKGWPLYYYASDSVTGDVNGDGAGSNWYVAKPDYTFMYAQTDDLGFYITNAAGRTIYLFGNDAADTNNFTNEDLSNNGAWPMVTLTLEEVPSILNKDDFGTIEVHGNTQVTYKGWPLYYYGSDTERGDAKGVSGIWPTTNADTAEASSSKLAVEESMY